MLLEMQMMDGEDLPGPERELPVPGPAAEPAPAPTPTGAPVAPVARDTGALLESFLFDR